MSATIADMARFMESGGAVMWALLALGVAMWTTLLLRGAALVRGGRAPVEQLVDGAATRPIGVLRHVAARAEALRRAREPVGRLRLHFERARQRLGRGATATEAMIAAAPLLGLLGTLTGMIDTFDGLGVRRGAQASEAMAGGISKALITTEFGLMLSIPGIFIARALRRRQARLERALDELEARLIARTRSASEDRGAPDSEVPS